MDARRLRRVRSLLLVMAAVVLGGGCALPPAALRGEFAPLTTAEAARGVQASEPVRWGGVIAEVRPSQERTCFLIVDMPLDDSARPVRVDQSGGRFLACAQGFLDPEVYAPDRLLTAAGWLSGTSAEKVGGYEYLAPIVEAYSVHLWPERPEYGYAWGPGPYWGWGPGVWAYGGPAFGPWGPYPFGPYYRPWMW
jgi:outer membrane lipoprotein